MVQAQKILLSVIRGATTYNMADYATLHGVMGAGMSPLNRIQTKGPLQHGSTDRGFRLQPRQLRLLFYFTRTGSDFFDNRQMLTRIFAPSENPLTLKFTLANGEVRNIKGHALSFPMNTDPSKVTYQSFAVDIMCPDPTFYDPETKTLLFSGSYSGNALEVPMAVNMFVGASAFDGSQILEYNGTFREFPFLIRVHGAITDCVITNNSTGEVLDFTGVSIPDGDYYDIDLRYSYKTVIDDSGVNKIADLTDGSDLATWHLATATEIADGINSITVTGSAINSNTQVAIQYYERFLGF